MMDNKQNERIIDSVLGDSFAKMFGSPKAGTFHPECHERTREQAKSEAENRG